MSILTYSRVSIPVVRKHTLRALHAHGCASSLWIGLARGSLCLGLARGSLCLGLARGSLCLGVARGSLCLAAVLTVGCSDSDAPVGDDIELGSAPFEAGSTTYCVVDPSRGFDETAGIMDGQRLLIVEAWYPVDREHATDPAAVPATFGDYFANDPELLLRTERALLTTTGFMPDVIEQHMTHAPAQFDVPRDSFRDAPVASASRPFPVVVYSHGTLQQRFTNDSMAEGLARQGYVVISPEHTGNDALAPLGALCGAELNRAGVKPDSLAANPSFDATRGEYRGQTFDPFFLVADRPPEDATINPVEVSLTLDRVGDYRAALAAAPAALGRFADGGSAVVDLDRVGLVGYSRGGMHGVVGAELIDGMQASVSLVGGTPLKFYARDPEAQPIHDAMMSASAGERIMLTQLTKPVLDMIGGEDSRRKSTTVDAANIGMYPMPTADNPSPIVRDSFDKTLGFGALVNIAEIDHFDLVDDPFVIAYRAQGGMTRTGAFDTTKMYTTRPVEERKEIRDHFVQATFDVFLKGQARGQRFAVGDFADRGVSVETRGQ